MKSDKPPDSDPLPEDPADADPVEESAVSEPSDDLPRTHAARQLNESVERMSSPNMPPGV